MFVCPPHKVDEDVVTASTIPEVDFESFEEPWQIYRDVSIDINNMSSLDFVDISEYKDGKFLAVNNTDTVYLLEYTNDNYPTNSINHSVLFTKVGQVFNSIGYAPATGFILCQDSGDADVHAYNESGDEQWVVSLPFAATATSICGVQDGFIRTSGTGGTAIGSFYRSNGFVFSFDIFSGATNAFSSCTTDGDILYCIDDAGALIAKFNVFEDNASALEEWNPSISSSRIGISYESWSRELCVYSAAPNKRIYKRDLKDATISGLGTDVQLFRAGDYCIYNTYRWLCLVGGTYDNPAIGALKSTPTWELVGGSIQGGELDYQFAQRANKYSPFDQTISRVSLTTGGTWTQSYVFGEDTDIIAMFNLTGSNANITVDDPVHGIIFDEDYALMDNSSVTDWYEYYFSPLKQLKSLLVWDIPAYNGATITITITGTDDVGVGEIVMAKSREIATTQYGTGGQLFDYSRVINDDFGNTTIQKRRNVKIIDYNLKLNTAQLENFHSTISDLTTTPCLWVGVTENDPTGGFTSVYGIYDSLQDNASTPSLSDATLKIKGLV